MKIEKIICLTMPNRQKYAENIDKILKNQGFNVFFQKGVDGFTIEEETIRKEYSDWISPYMKWQENRKARLAICLSHLSIWKSLTDSIDYTLIIEDDVLLDFDLKEKLNNIASKLTLEWDLLFIGHAGALNGQCMGDITFAKSGNEENSNHGMFAYFVNPKSILKLIKSITPIFKMQHIDWLLRKKYSNDKNGIKAIYFNESIIKHNNDIVSERRLIDKKK